MFFLCVLILRDVDVGPTPLVVGGSDTACGGCTHNNSFDTALPFSPPLPLSVMGACDQCLSVWRVSSKHPAACRTPSFACTTHGSFWAWPLGLLGVAKRERCCRVGITDEGSVHVNMEEKSECLLKYVHTNIYIIHLTDMIYVYLKHFRNIFFELKSTTWSYYLSISVSQYENIIIGTVYFPVSKDV